MKGKRKQFLKLGITFMSWIFFLGCGSGTISAAMTINSQTTLGNGLKIDAKGNISSVSDLTDPGKVHLNVEAPANMSDQAFYDLMLKSPICWSGNSQLQILSGTTTDPIPKKSGWKPSGTTFDLTKGLPRFRLTNVSTTYSGKSVDVIVSVNNIQRPKGASQFKAEQPDNETTASAKASSKDELESAAPSRQSSASALSSSSQVNSQSGTDQVPVSAESSQSKTPVDDKQKPVTEVSKTEETADQTPKPETAKAAIDRKQPQISFSAGSDQAINSYIKNLDGVSISYQFVDHQTGQPLNVMVFPAINDVDAQQVFGLNGDVLGYDTDTLHSVGAGTFQGSDIGVNGADDYPKGGILYQFYGNNIQTNFTDPRGIDKADWSMSGIFGVYGSLRNGTVSRPSQGKTTRTIKFLKDGQPVKPTVEQAVRFKGSDVFKITGNNVQKVSNVKPDGSDTWANVKAPAASGYIPDQPTVDEKQVTEKTTDETKVITYYPKTALKVSDKNEHDTTHNQLTDGQEAFTYTAQQKMPALVDGASPLQQYQMAFKVDQKVNFKQVQVLDENGQDVTNAFTVEKSNGNEVTVAANQLTATSFYGHTYTVKGTAQKVDPKNNKPVIAMNTVTLNGTQYDTNQVTTSVAGKSKVVPPAKKEQHGAKPKAHQAQHKASPQRHQQPKRTQPHHAVSKPQKHLTSKRTVRKTVPQVTRKRAPQHKTIRQAVGQKRQTNHTVKHVIAHQNAHRNSTPVRRGHATVPRHQGAKAKATSSHKPKSKSKSKPKGNIFQQNTGITGPQQKKIKSALNKIARYGHRHHWSRERIQRTQLTLLTPSYRDLRIKGWFKTLPQYMASGSAKRDVRQLNKILGKGNVSDVDKIMRNQENNGGPDLQHALVAAKGYLHGNWWSRVLMTGRNNKTDMLYINTLVGDANQSFGDGDFGADVDVIRMLKSGYLKPGQDVWSGLMGYYNHHKITDAERHGYVNTHLSRKRLSDLDKSFGGIAILIATGLFLALHLKLNPKFLTGKARAWAENTFYPKWRRNPKRRVHRVPLYKRVGRGFRRVYNGARRRFHQARRGVRRVYRRARRRVRRVYRQVRHGVRRVYRQARRRVRRVYRQVRHGVRRVYRRARRRVRRVYRQVRHGVRRVYRRARRRFRRVYRRARRRVRRVYRRVRRRVRRVYGRVRRRVRRVYRRVRRRFRRVYRRARRFYRRIRYGSRRHRRRRRR